MLTCIAFVVELMTVMMCQNQTRKNYPFLLSTMMLAFAFASFLVLMFSLHSNYLWLTTFLVIMILLATFTCTYSMPRVPDFLAETTGDTSRANMGQPDDSPIWVIVDPPPTYESAVESLPPSYSKVTGNDILQMISESSATPAPSSVAESSTRPSTLDALTTSLESASEVTIFSIQSSSQNASSASTSDSGVLRMSPEFTSDCGDK